MTNSQTPQNAGISQRARKEILALSGYVSARSLQKPGMETVFLDANECAYDPFIGAVGLSRYPEQQPVELVQAMCRWLDVSSRHLTITRGADEAIDCLMRAFCTPMADNVVICPPTFAMYAQSAMLQSVETRSAPLTQDFDLDLESVAACVDDNTKIVFVCSPNNPTGNVMSRQKVMSLCAMMDKKALVVVDETYIEFSNSKSFI
ncbi:MAG: aminotransferase class I/II-fold pyridoxal phosphate-dependent enzyme, partial [Candidatus Puniceispirillum sp.]